MLGHRPTDRAGSWEEKGTQLPLLETGSEAEGPGPAQALGKACVPAVPLTHPFLISPAVPN